MTIPGLAVTSSSQTVSAPAQKILDVGCGQNKYPGAIGIDSNPRSNADVIHDLGILPYPFADNEFDEIICRHVIEHVPDVMSFERASSHNEACRTNQDCYSSLFESRLANRSNSPQSFQQLLLHVLYASAHSIPVLHNCRASTAAY